MEKYPRNIILLIICSVCFVIYRLNYFIYSMQTSPMRKVKNSKDFPFYFFEGTLYLCRQLRITVHTGSARLNRNKVKKTQVCFFFISVCPCFLHTFKYEEENAPNVVFLLLLRSLFYSMLFYR